MSDMVSTALDRVQSTLMIDDRWAVRTDRELTWTGFRLGQTFSVEGPYDSYGHEVCRISSTVPVMAGCQAARMDDGLSALNHLTAADALVWHRTEGVLKSHVAAVFHEQTIEWRLTQFVSLAIVQLSLLEARLDLLAQLLKGGVVEWPHPVSGHRPHPDDMLSVVRDVFQPVGQEPSRFLSEGDFRAVEQWLEGTQFYTMGSNEQGLAIEVPFGPRDTSLIQVYAHQPHPILGNGLLASLQIRAPEQPSGRSTAALASDLNWWEIHKSRSMNQYGAWHAKDDLLAHAFFLPNAEFRPGIQLDTAIQQIQRAIWADQILNGADGVDVMDAARIVFERLSSPSKPQKTFEA